MAKLPSWSLKDFAADHGKMKVGTFTNSETKEDFRSCIFVNGDNICLVGFSSKLGELTAKQISEQKDDLQIIQIESGSYKLCRKGESTWEDVDL